MKNFFQAIALIIVVGIWFAGGVWCTAMLLHILGVK